MLFRAVQFAALLFLSMLAPLKGDASPPSRVSDMPAGFTSDDQHPVTAEPFVPALSHIELAQADTAETRPSKLSSKTSGESADKKIAVPDAGSQQSSRKSIKELHRADYAKAKRPEGKADLARSLMIEAGQTDQDAVRYVLLTEAMDLAVAAGKLDLALEAVQAVAARFDVDVPSLKERAAAKVNAAAMLPADAELLLEKFFVLADEAADVEQFALAAKFMQSAADAFKKPIFKPLREQAVAGNKHFAALRETFETAKQSRDLLDTDPTNATANLAWGKYLCFNRKDFEAGLPYLAKGNDKSWAPVAVRDLAQSTDINSLLQLGDDWLKLGDRAKDPIRSSTRIRASQEWATALAQASPALQSDVEQKLDPRLAKLWGTSYVVTTGDAAGESISGTEPYSPGAAFTIEFWVSTRETTGTLLSKRQTAADLSVILHIYDGAPQLSLATPGEGGSLGGTPINDGRWHHIALTKQGDDLKLFVDGKTVHTSTAKIPLVSNSAWLLGSSYMRIPCAARFGGLRISNTVRYAGEGPFSPRWIHPKDRRTLYSQ
jgi:hypothetical protein